MFGIESMSSLNVLSKKILNQKNLENLWTSNYSYNLILIFLPQPGATIVYQDHEEDGQRWALGATGPPGQGKLSRTFAEREGRGPRDLLFWTTVLDVKWRTRKMCLRALFLWLSHVKSREVNSKITIGKLAEAWRYWKRKLFCTLFSWLIRCIV